MKQRGKVGWLSRLANRGQIGGQLGHEGYLRRTDVIVCMRGDQIGMAVGMLNRWDEKVGIDVSSTLLNLAKWR